MTKIVSCVPIALPLFLTTALAPIDVAQQSVPIFDVQATGSTIGLDAVHGFNTAGNIANGSGYVTFRSVVEGLGHTIVDLTSFGAADLVGLDAVFLVQPYSQNLDEYTASEIDAVEAFVAAGGGLVVLADNGSGFNVPNINALVASYGISFADAPSSPSGHVITGFVDHPITEGLAEIGVDFQLTITTAAPGLDLTTGSGEDDALSVLALPGTRAVFLSDTSNWLETSDHPISFGDNQLLLENILNYVTPGTVLDFETEDDMSTPLVNGQDISSPPEFGNIVSISGSGSNASAAVFDSNPGGPNVGSQDGDLLVDRGNLLILQNDNASGQSVSGIFDFPNDDPDGGTLAFAFAAPVTPNRVDLMDIDAGIDEVTRVVLTDMANNIRTYTVPPEWTGDRLENATAGERTLDLTFVGPQPGFNSTVTSSEDAGFDRAAVLRIEVNFGSSGALDNLSFRMPEGSSPAVADVRDGSGLNPESLSSVSMPIVGASWNVDLDCTPHGTGFALFFVFALPGSGLITPFGEVLVAGSQLFARVRAHAGSLALFSQSIPNNPSLVGFEATAQGLCTGAPAPQLSNALDVVLGGGPGE